MMVMVTRIKMVMMVMMVMMIAMMTIWRCMVTRMKMVIYIMTMMMMMMTIGRRRVATGSGGQEMEQLKLINQPLIYWGDQGSEKFSNPNMKIRR